MRAGAGGSTARSARHEAQVAEMRRRGFRHASPLDASGDRRRRCRPDRARIFLDIFNVFPRVTDRIGGQRKSPLALPHRTSLNRPDP